MSGENANKKKALVEWTAECQQAYEQLCSQTPILAYANYKKPFKLHTDASENGLGAVLYLEQEDGTDHVMDIVMDHVGHCQSLREIMMLISWEFLALKWSVMERLHEYLYGGYFEVSTDINPLTYILTTAKLDATRQR